MNDRRVIEVINAHKSFGDRKILDGIGMHVCHGEVVSVLGVSGSGKTTLFNLITKLESVDEGEIRCSSEIGYMLQKDLLMPWKTIEENIALPLMLKGIKKKDAINQVGRYLETFGLEGTGSSYPGALSGGMRQRAALLRTWFISGEIMLLDEPFSSVDAITRHRLHKWLQGIIDRMELTILLITHDVEEALTLSDRVYIMGGSPASMAGEMILTRKGCKGSDKEIIQDKASARQMILDILEKDLE